MRSVIKELAARLEANETVILGSVVRSSGSVPRSSGARMLVCSDGTLFGSIGGGAAEGKCYARAKELLGSEHGWQLFEFHLESSEAATAGMVCGGRMSILLLKLQSKHLDLVKRIRTAFSEPSQSLRIVTVLPRENVEPLMTLVGDGLDSGLSDELLAAVTGRKGRTPFSVEADGVETVVEPLSHPGVVHIVGAGHVALATAELAVFAGFDVVVMDDRREFANIQRFPRARNVVVLESFNSCLKDLGRDDYVVIVTRGHLHDKEVLAQALVTGANYIGMIGSRRKRKAIYESLVKEGFTEKDLARVHSPIGLAIGAETPAEIGLSIVAELVKVRSEQAV